MKILTFGTVDINYKNKEGRQITGVEVHAIVTEPDEEDNRLNGNRTFEQFFSSQNLKEPIEINQEYTVVFVTRKFNGTYQALPHHLEKVK